MAWSAIWLLAARELEGRVDDGVRTLATRGVVVEWSDRRISGYPFRLNLAMTDLRVRLGGWRLQIPDFEAQAYLHASRSWLAAAPQGLTICRPAGGALEVQGDRLLSSLVLTGSGPPRVSIEGLDLRFRPGPGARPFALASAERLEFHIRPGPDDQAAVFMRLEDGTPSPGRLFDDLGGGGLVSARLDARLNHASALRGEGLNGALAAWSSKGGRLDLKEAGLTVGEARLSIGSPGLRAGADGRLQGRLSVTATQAPSLLMTLTRHGVLSPAEAAGGLAAVLILGRRNADEVRLDLDLAAGRIRPARSG